MKNPALQGKLPGPGLENGHTSYTGISGLLCRQSSLSASLPFPFLKERCKESLASTHVVLLLLPGLSFILPLNSYWAGEKQIRGTSESTRNQFRGWRTTGVQLDSPLHFPDRKHY